MTWRFISKTLLSWIMKKKLLFRGTSTKIQSHVHVQAIIPPTFYAHISFQSIAIHSIYCCHLKAYICQILIFRRIIIIYNFFRFILSKQELCVFCDEPLQLSKIDILTDRGIVTLNKASYVLKKVIKVILILLFIPLFITPLHGNKLFFINISWPLAKVFITSVDWNTTKIVKNWNKYLQRMQDQELLNSN